MMAMNILYVEGKKAVMCGNAAKGKGHRASNSQWKTYGFVAEATGRGAGIHGWPVVGSGPSNIGWRMKM